MCFNDIPGVDDDSGVTLRRLGLARFAKKAIENPVGPNQIKMDKALQLKFSSKAYGACFLGFLIEVFGERGHDFETPESAMLASKEYIEENKLLSQFIDEAYERTGNHMDRIPIKHTWDIIVTMREYYDQLRMNASHQLAGRLRLMEFDITKVHQASYVCGLKAKDKFLQVAEPPCDHNDDDDDV